MVVTLQNHSGILNGTICILAAQLWHPLVHVFSKAPLGTITDCIGHPSD